MISERLEPSETIPSRWGFYFRTWSGRIVLLNGVIFVLMAIGAQSLLMPSEEILLRFGAKDPVALAEGQWWRFLSPMFVHIGLLHFVVNSYALKSIGPQIESIFKARWFLTIYIGSGIAGNVASSVFNLRLSAGASGAIFGLLGSGLIIETYVRCQLERSRSPYQAARTYSTLAAVNLILGVVVPGIDNAAHIGGLVCGAFLTMALLRLHPNRLMAVKPAVGYFLLAIFSITTLVLAVVGSNRGIVHGRMCEGGDVAYQNFLRELEPEDRLDFAREAYYLYSRALEIEPDSHVTRFKLGRLLILAGDVKSGLGELAEVATDPTLHADFSQLVRDLKAAGRHSDSDLVAELTGEVTDL